MPVRVEPIPQDAWLDALTELPARLYADDPCFVPAPRAWLRARYRSTNPFFREATVEAYRARRGPRTVGTVTVLRDSTFADEGVAWFGHFECEDDDEAADALVATAVDRARGWGARALRGGRDLTRFENIGITVEGFDRLPPLLQGQHRRAYARMLEARGFVKHHDVLAWERDLWQPDGTPAPIPAPLARRAAACDLPGLVLRRLRYRTLEADLRAAHGVLNEAYATVPDIRPMPLATFRAMGLGVAACSRRDLVQLAFLGDRPVAFSMCVPELNEALVRGRGRWGAVGALAAARRIRTAAFKLIGVVPELRGTGLHARMIVEVVEGARRAGFSRVEGSVIDERNGPMTAVVEGAGMRVYRRYRIYERPLR